MMAFSVSMPARFGDSRCSPVFGLRRCQLNWSALAETLNPVALRLVSVLLAAAASATGPTESARTVPPNAMIGVSAAAVRSPSARTSNVVSVSLMAPVRRCINSPPPPTSTAAPASVPAAIVRSRLAATCPRSRASLSRLGVGFSVFSPSASLIADA
jgi:hypothetical protein